MVGPFPFPFIELCDGWSAPRSCNVSVTSQFPSPVAKLGGVGEPSAVLHHSDFHSGIGVGVGLQCGPIKPPEVTFSHVNIELSIEI